jgi:polyhydroxyalkanoate synthesis repressor PhaR
MRHKSLDENDAPRYIGDMKAVSPGAAERLIRRYDNRKLYDAQVRRYVTLEELARLIAAGTDVRVVEQRTGEDITTVVLAQVVLEGIKQRTANIPHQVLSRLIRLGSSRAGGLAEWLDPQEASMRARHEAERIVSGLVTRGRLTLDEALALRQDIAGSAQRLAAEAQAGVQARLRRLLDSSDDQGVNPALQALKERLSTFEDLLAPPRAPARRRPLPARKSRKK